MIGRFLRHGRKRKALKAYEAAQTRAAEAENRGDDRDMGRARMEMRQAMIERLKAETVRVRR